MFLAASLAQPLCLIIEDLHWIDSETQQALDNLVNSVAAARVLLLVNYRPEYQHPWGSKTYYGQVRLDTLPVESASELLDVLLGPDVGLAPLKQLLVNRGNPFFLEETIRMLVETSALAGERGRYRLTHPIETIQVPATVHAMLAARIDRLAPEDRHLLQVASVIGKDVPLSLLEAVAVFRPKRFTAAWGAYRRPSSSTKSGLLPELEYTFKHALTQDVAYASLLEDRRRSLHAALAGAIERLRRSADEHLEELAQHARRGDLRAGRHVSPSGGRARPRPARPTARRSRCFDQALTALGELPETRRRWNRPLIFASTLNVPRSARRIRADRRPSSRSRRPGPGTRRSMATRPAVRPLCHILGLAGGFDGGDRVRPERPDSSPSRSGMFSLKVTGNLYLGAACLWTGDYRRAEDLFLKVLRLLEGYPSRERFHLTGFPAVIARCYFDFEFR